jgi:endonuclease YncB( thermonuclease family)
VLLNEVCLRAPWAAEIRAIVQRFSHPSSIGIGSPRPLPPPLKGRETHILLAVCFLLSACGPNLGSLEPGEAGRVVRAYNGDTLELDTGLRVFLAEIDAPRGDAAYASQAQGELEALALHRDVRLAYGGVKRWVPQDGQPRSETAIAHVFVQSEGGRWFWLQHALVSRGAAYVRPRKDNNARADMLLPLERRAREDERGLWGRREHRPLDARAAARAALVTEVSCLSRDAPYRLVEGRVAEVLIDDDRATLTLEGGARDRPFSIVVFGDDLSVWSGPALSSLGGAEIRVRAPLGVFDGAPQACMEHASQLELLQN